MAREKHGVRRGTEHEGFLGGGVVTDLVGAKKLNGGSLRSMNDLEVKLFSVTVRSNGKQLLRGGDKSQQS